MKNRMLIVSIVLAAVFLKACSEASVPADTDQAQQMRDLLADLAVDDGSFPAPAPPALPLDLTPHSNSQVESFVLQVIVFADNELTQHFLSASAGLIAQLERLALTSSVDAKPADSAWRYRGVIRSQIVSDAMEQSIGKIETKENERVGSFALAALANAPGRQSVQRMALQLAGADKRGLWVGGDRLLIELTEPETLTCQRDYHWTHTLTATMSIELNFSLAQCPDVQTLGTLNTWQHAGFALSGRLVSQSVNAVPLEKEITGFGWLRQSWGLLPPLGEAAVLIDSLQLRLDDGRVLDITRSKRRSGRGPRTVSARVQVPGEQWKNLSLSWEDSVEQRKADSGQAYPATIRITSTDESMDIQVAPMNRMIESTAQSDRQLFSPVSVDGSHHGAGFVTYIALPASP